MASSGDAFRMFAKWKDAKTLLNFTDFSHPGTKYKGHISHVDDFVKDFTVGFTNEITHDAVRINFRGAVFLVEERFVRAARPDFKDLIFEEDFVM
jgi:hypothetical protein